MTKIQLTLTNQEISILNSYGSQFGYNLSKTVKFFISKASEEIIKSGLVPIFEMNDKTEKKGLEALKEHREGKSIKVDNIEKFINQL